MPGSLPDHWLYRLTADEWLRAGIHELGVARDCSRKRQTRAALASARRAAGMGWNAVLALQGTPDERFGRSYVDHLRALAECCTEADSLPDEVRRAARALLDDPAAGSRDIVPLRTPKRDEHMLDAAETILAEAYTQVARHDVRSDDRGA